MSREILFKAKDINSGEWVEGYYAYIGGKHSIIPKVPEIVSLYFNSTAICHIDIGTLCQYTGLIDKNGRKIFEGDIVHWKRNVLALWEDMYSSWGLRANEWMRPHYFGEDFMPEDCEVVGNKFDNPEMLEE